MLRYWWYVHRAMSAFTPTTMARATGTVGKPRGVTDAAILPGPGGRRNDAPRRRLPRSGAQVRNRRCGPAAWALAFRLVYDADAVELRVLGCLIEKQRTTPDAYPLSLNSLRLACNQTTNRDPIVSYEEPEIRAALERLGRRGWTRLASASRAVKYRHLFGDAIGVDDEEISLLAVLMLRGPQTVGELKARTERLHRFADVGEVEAALQRLIDRELAERQERRPGQKEERFA